MGMERMILRLAPSGLVYDVPPDGVDPNVFTGGSNVVFRDGLPVRAGGQLAVYGTPLHEPHLLVNLQGPLANYWIYPGQSAVGVLDGVSHADISPTPALTPTQGFNQWTGGELNGIVCLNNPYNNPIYWPGTMAQDCQYLPGWPAGTKAKVLRPFKYHLFALNVTDTNGIFSDLVVWSDAAEPGAVPQTWTPAPDNQAGFFALAAGGGNIVDAVQMRDVLFAFMDSSTWAIQYVGGNAVFAARKVLETSGILAPNCAVEIKGSLVVLTDSDVIVFDGQQALSLIDKKMRRFLFSQLDPVNYRNAFVTKNWVESEVWVCIPTVGNVKPNLALVWSRDENAWGLRTINYSCASAGLVSPNTGVRDWDESAQSWDNASLIWDSSTYRVTSESILAAQGTTLQSVDGDVTDNGVPVVSYLQKVGLGLGNIQQRKLIKRVWPRMSGVTGTVVDIRVGAHDEPNGQVTWADPVAFAIGADEKIDTFAEGRYMALEIASNSVQPWTLTGIDVEYGKSGAW